MTLPSKRLQFSVSGPDQQYGPADVLIVKDVLQHLPLRDAMAIVEQLHRFKIGIFVNDMSENTPNLDVDLKTGLSMQPGLYRSINVSLPPFNLVCDQTLRLHSNAQSVLPGDSAKVTCIVGVAAGKTSNEEL